jgi:transposase
MAVWLLSGDMGGHMDRAGMLVLDVMDTGRRRRWTDKGKLRIVGQSHADPRLVSATARRDGFSRSLLTTWRRLHREGLLVDRAAASFAPVTVKTERLVAPVAPAEKPTTALSADASHRVEVVLRNGRRIVIDARLDPSARARLIAVVKGA